MDITIKMKKQISALAPLFGLLGQSRGTEMPENYSQSHFRHWVLAGHNIVQHSPGKETGTGFMMKVFANCFHTQRAQTLLIL